MGPRSRPVAGWLAVCSVVALAACGGGSAAPDTAAPVTSAAPVVTSAAPVVAPATPATSPATSATSPAPAPVLVLETDGVGVLTGTSIRHLTFGTDISTMTQVLERTLGPMERTAMDECGQGPRVQLGGQSFSALFDGAAFVGWLDAGRTRPRLTTVSGVGVGSTLAAVRSVYADVEVTTATLGPEWTTGDVGLGGLLDGTGPTSKVVQIYAGETCFFR